MRVPGCDGSHNELYNLFRFWQLAREQSQAVNLYPGWIIQLSTIVHFSLDCPDACRSCSFIRSVLTEHQHNISRTSTEHQQHQHRALQDATSLVGNSAHRYPAQQEHVAQAAGRPGLTLLVKADKMPK